MSKAKVQWALGAWSASVGTWSLAYLLHGGWGNVVGILFSVLGVGVCVHLLVRGKR